MGTTNYGDQIITYNFRGPGTSEYFNKLNYDILPRGIYSGGELSKNTFNSVKITPSIIYVKDFGQKLSVKIALNDNSIFSVSEQKPYIIGRFKWSGFGNDFLQIFAEDFNSIEEEDIIFGRCVYRNNSLKDQFDYTRREKPFLSDIKETSVHLKVISTEPFSRRVKIRAGGIQTVNKSFFINDTLSPELSDTVDGRVDLICINSSGEIYTVEGEDSVSPITPLYKGRLVLAEIHRGALEAFITEADIVNIERKNFDFSQISVSGENTGAALIHSGDLKGLNTSDNLQEEMNNLFKQLDVGKFLVTYGETITKNDPVGKASDGKYRKATKNFEYDASLGLTDTFTMEGYRFRVLTFSDYLMMVYVDATNTCKLKAYREDGVGVVVSNELTLASNVLEMGAITVNRDSFIVGVGNTSDETLLYSGYWDHGTSVDITLDGGPLNPARVATNTTSNIQLKELPKRTGGITEKALIAWVDHTENVTRMNDEYGEDFYYQNTYNSQGCPNFFCFPPTLQCHEAIQGTAPDLTWGMPDLAVVKYVKDTGLTLEVTPTFAYKNHPILYERNYSVTPTQWPKWSEFSHTPSRRAFSNANLKGDNRIIDNIIFSLKDDTSLVFYYDPSVDVTTLQKIPIYIFTRTTDDQCPNIDLINQDYYIYYSSGFPSLTSICEYFWSDSDDIINRDTINGVGTDTPEDSIYAYSHFSITGGLQTLNTISRIIDIEQYPNKNHDYSIHSVYLGEEGNVVFANNRFSANTSGLLTSHDIGDSECPLMTLRPDGGAIALLKDNISGTYYFIFSPSSSSYDLLGNSIDVSALVDLQEPVSLDYVGAYIVLTYKDSTNTYRSMFYQSISYEGLAFESGVLDEQKYIIKSRKFLWGGNVLTPYANYYVDYTTESVTVNTGDERIGFALNDNELFLE